MSEKQTPAQLDAYSTLFGITKSDTTVFHETRGLWVGSVGDVKVRDINGNIATFVAVAAGTLLKIRVNMVFSGGTSAGNFVGMY